MKQLLRALIAVLVSMQALVALSDDAISDDQTVLGFFSNVNRRITLFKQARKKGVLAYRFDHSSSVDFANRRVYRVWKWRDGKMRLAESAPLPTVIYDYCFYSTRTAQERKVAAQIREQLINRGIPFFVPKKAVELVRDKVAFSKVARKHALAHPMTMVASPHAVQGLLADHGLVYAKPVSGNQGYGIIVVEREPRGETYSLRYKRRGPKAESWTSVVNDGLSPSMVWPSINDAKEVLERSGAHYLAQQGIRSLSYRDRQTYFRAMTHRGAGGRLMGGTILAKVGGNLAQGGRAYPRSKILRQWQKQYGLNAKQLTNRLVEVALSTHLAIERAVGQQVGELGMDLVVDHEGRAYVLEANNKSSYLFMHRMSDLRQHDKTVPTSSHAR